MKNPHNLAMYNSKDISVVTIPGPQETGQSRHAPMIVNLFLPYDYTLFSIHFYDRYNSSQYPVATYSRSWERNNDIEGILQ